MVHVTTENVLPQELHLRASVFICG